MIKAVYFLLITTTLIIGKDAWSIDNASGKELLSLCNVTSSERNADERFSRCEHLIQEVRRSLSNTSINGARACIPKRISDLKLLYAVLNWLEVNPRTHHMEARVILAQIFAENWPCLKRSS